ncbi:hypothetical protein BDZ45DRAFT_749909 [Acephala macrosclerotiorum]|nr:hypothetical protein BDZ45DRAFT_749909 [Acephala macrosclerotiorum]
MNARTIAKSTFSQTNSSKLTNIFFMGKHKIHRTPSWKRDTLLLTCILRLRIQPPTPYPLIVSLLFVNLPEIAHKLATKQSPRDLRPTITQDEQKLMKWLEKYLEERYKLAEDWASATWIQARDWDIGIVKEILEALGLNRIGFVVRGNQDTKLQISWGDKGDWRVGSGQHGKAAERGLMGERSSIQEMMCESPEDDFDVGLQQALFGVWAYAQAPELLDTSVGELQRPWDSTVGTERQAQTQQERSPIRQLHDAMPGPYNKGLKSLDPEVESKRWQDQQQRMGSLLQDLEAIRFTHQRPPQDLQHTLGAQQQPQVYTRSSEHLVMPSPRLVNSFNRQLEDILKLEKLIHEQDSMDEADYETRIESKTTFNMLDYGESKTFAEMAAGKSPLHLLVVS